MSAQIEFNLVGGSVPRGEIGLSDLVKIAGALQELSLRIGRAQAEAAGPGRSANSVEALTELRLLGVSVGSTKLLVVQGLDNPLPIDWGDEEALRDRFWEIIEGIAADARPQWVTALIADSAAELVAALKGAAREVTVSADGRQPVTIVAARVHRNTWASPSKLRGKDMLVVTGRLEKVDLHTHNFRVKDDVGNNIELEAVPQADDVARLIGARVRAEGAAMRSRAGRLTGLVEPTIEPHQPPGVQLGGIPANSIGDLLQSAPGPDPAGAVDLDEDELAGFLAATSQ